MPRNTCDVNKTPVHQAANTHTKWLVLFNILLHFHPPARNSNSSRRSSDGGATKNSEKGGAQQITTMEDHAIILFICCTRYVGPDYSKASQSPSFRTGDNQCTNCSTDEASSAFERFDRANMRMTRLVTVVSSIELFNFVLSNRPTKDNTYTWHRNYMATPCCLVGMEEASHYNGGLASILRKTSLGQAKAQARSVPQCENVTPAVLRTISVEARVVEEEAAPVNRKTVYGLPGDAPTWISH